MRPASPFRPIVATFVCLALASCTSESGPEDGIAGTWEATELTLTVDDETTDLLAEGAELRLVLTDGGATSGTFFVPGAFTESGDDETLSLAGTYTYDANERTATFEHVADTFIRDVGWALDGDELHSAFPDATGGIRATLEWQP